MSITTYPPRSVLYDKSGNVIDSHITPDGEYHLGAAIAQDVYADANNSSDTNLTSGNSYTFTGTATSTLGVVGLQWSLKTDQNATVYIDQSPDGIEWDISDTFDYHNNLGGAGETVQAVNSYWRIRVILTGTSDTTYFRLQGVLCPIALPLPRSLNAYGRLKTSSSIIDEETGKQAQVEPLGSLKTIIPTRLVGTGFDGTKEDSNFWTKSAVSSATVVQAGGLILSTGATTANSAVTYTSVKNARKVPGSANQFRTVVRLSSVSQANNFRRIGAYNISDGYFFQVKNTTFGVVARKAGIDTEVNSGSFNGNYGTSVGIGTELKRLTIEYTAVSTKFYINDTLLHTISSTNASLTNTQTLPVTIENNNFGGNSTDNTLEVRFATILRLGQLNTNPQYKFINSNITAICKYNAGQLHSIINLNNAGTITVHDGISTSGVTMAIIDAAKVLGALAFDAPFSNGLTVTLGGGAVATFVYE